MTAPTVSVVLPTHNRIETLPRAIGSVLHQSFTDLELIIVDDASDQDVASVVKSFADDRVRYIRRAEQGGPGAARNTGIEQARGTYLAFQDSDDEWLLDKLATQIEFMRQQPAQVALVSCAIVGYRQGHRVAPFADPGADNAALTAPHKLIKTLAFAYTQTWLLRRDVLAASGLFDEQLRIWEDRDLLMRIAQGHAIRYQPAVLVIAYRQTDSLSLNSASRIRSLERLIDKNEPAEGGNRRLLAWLNYLLGRAHMLAGESSIARQALTRSLRLWPWQSKPWAWLLLTISKTPSAAWAAHGKGQTGPSGSTGNGREN